MRLKKEANWLYKYLSKLESNIDDCHSFIYDYFYTIRNKIDLRVEYILVETSNKNKEHEIRQIHEEIIERLSKLEEKCMDDIKKSESLVNTVLFKDKIKELKSKLDSIETDADWNIEIHNYKDWIKYNALKQKFYSIKNETNELKVKLKFILLNGLSIYFVDKSKKDESYVFNINKLVTFSAYDYCFNQQRVDKDLAEKIYIYEVITNLFFK
jgi:hypothetical protein